jgi:uncharacterized protein YceK
MSSHPVRRTALSVMVCTALASGCMTFDTRTNPGYTGPPMYSGARTAAGNAGQAFTAFNLPFFAFFLVDTVLSTVADTLLLPLTAIEQSKWSEARERRQRIDVEQPSLVTPAAKEDPLRTARRLFKACENLARNLNPMYTDCYTIEAQIEIKDEDGDVRTLTGKEYKEEIRAVITARRGGTRFVRYLEPQFDVEGDRVRVRAVREESGIQERLPIEFVFGPGSDGGWRILEEKGPGWR